MNNFMITIFNIDDIRKPINLDEFIIKSKSKKDAADEAHSIADERYPLVKKLVETKHYFNGLF